MAITDIIPSKQTGSDGFECPHYAPPAGERRCRHFLKNGACDRPDQVMCLEWMKRNRPEAVGGRPEGTEKRPDFRLEVQDTPRVDPCREQSRDGRVAASDLQPPLSGLQPDQIESFRKLGVEVCLQSESFGELWLVPAYTGQDRKEITPEHAATICQVLQAFPGSRVAAFEKISTNDMEASI